MSVAKKSFSAGVRSVERDMHLLGNQIVAAAQNYLEDNGVNNDGQLSKSINYTVERKGNKLLLTVGTNQKYAVFVHEGTRPHWAPDAPIREWVRKKLGVSDPKKLDKVTWAVRAKIARKGTPARPFMDHALNLYRNVLTKRVTKALLRAM